jgi:predicted aspartyl protease
VSFRFPYAPDPMAILPAGVVPPGVPPVRYRPLIPIRVFGPAPNGRQLQLNALVDSGSDWTVCRKHIAAMIGVSDFFAVTSVSWRGAVIPLEIARIDIEISNRGRSWRWPAVVGFVDVKLPFPCLLGQTGCLELLHSQFLGDQRALELDITTVFRAVGGTDVP